MLNERVRGSCQCIVKSGVARIHMFSEKALVILVRAVRDR